MVIACIQSCSTVITYITFLFKFIGSHSDQWKSALLAGLVHCVGGYYGMVNAPLSHQMHIIVAC